MNAGLNWLSLRFPREVTPVQGLAALLALNGASTPRRRDSFIIEVAASTSGIEHRLGLPDARAKLLSRQLEATMPGLAIEAVDPPTIDASIAWLAWQSSRERSLRTDLAETTSLALLTALGHVRKDEALLLQWTLGPVLRPAAVATQVPGSHRGHPAAVLAKAFLQGPGDLDSDAVRGLRTKRSLPGWKAQLLLGVTASTPERRRQLLGGLTSALRMGQAPGVELGFRPTSRTRLVRRHRPLLWQLRINAAELLGLSGLPLGDTGQLPVSRIRSRQLPASRALPRQGHVLGVNKAGGQDRPVALSTSDALRHLHVVGSTGSGKSTVLLNLITQDMAAGRSVVLIEPQGDLVEEVLARVPGERRDDVVVIDPASSRPVGLNPLHQPGVTPELIADQVLAVFKGVWADAWGPRTQDLLTAGLLTLARTPGSSLVMLPTLFSDTRFRRDLLARSASDPLGVEPFWAWWDSLGPSEQAAALAAPMNKLRQFVIRPPLRRVVGQLEPGFDLREVFRRRHIVLFDLKKGLLGPEATALLGSLALSMTWQAALGRVAVPVKRRAPVFLYVDEFQDYLHLPQDFAEVLAQARKLGLGLTLSHQHLGQLPNAALRTALLTNARSRLIFATGQDDAQLLTKSDNRLSPEDVTELASFHAYAMLLAGNQAQPTASIETLPPPPASQDANELRDAAAQRWGTPADAVDAGLEAAISVPRPTVRATPAQGFGVTKRPPSSDEAQGGQR